MSSVSHAMSIGQYFFSSFSGCDARFSFRCRLFLFITGVDSSASDISTSSVQFRAKVVEKKFKLEKKATNLEPAQNFAMLVLYETPLGLCLFKLTDAGKLEKDSLWKEFQTPERAASLYVLSFDPPHRLSQAQRIALGGGKCSRC
jgi:NOP5NT (NUC127) domain